MKGPLVAVLLTAALCSGCSAPDTAADSAPSMPAPVPAGIATVPASAPPKQPAAQECGDPLASLRPRGDVTQGSTLDAIRRRGRLVVGLDTGSNLFSFRDPQSGTIEGFDVDIAKEVARDLFGDPERVQWRILGSSERVSALQNNQVDVIVKTMSITCERRQQVTFSTEYLPAHQRILTRRPDAARLIGSDIPPINGIADLAGKRVCVVAGTTSLQNVQRLQPAATLITVPSWADCLIVLQQRQVDAVSTDDTILTGLAQQDTQLQLVGDNLSNEAYGIGIGVGHDDLVRFVNHTLERIRSDGTWDRSYRTWLTLLGPSPGAPAPHYAD